MDYETFWYKNGTSYITPQGKEWPEGFDIKAALDVFCRREILEIGCGTGRIAQLFDPDEYTGVDINQRAIDEARARLPQHNFLKVGVKTNLPKADTAIFYTVCLHIPDELILDQLKRAARAANRVVICEIMNKKFRRESRSYDISNHRTINEYEQLMKQCGFQVQGAIERPYAHYPGENMTLACFWRPD